MRLFIIQFSLVVFHDLSDVFYSDVSVFEDRGTFVKFGLKLRVFFYFTVYYSEEGSVPNFSRICFSAMGGSLFLFTWIFAKHLTVLRARTNCVL